MNESLNRLREMGFRVLQVADTNAKSTAIKSSTLDAVHKLLNSPPSAPLGASLAPLPTVSASDIDALGNIWARQNAPLALPPLMLELYRSSLNNGFFFSVAVLRGQTAGNKAGETVIISCCRLHAIQLVQQVHVDERMIEEFNAARRLQPSQQPSSDDQFFALSLASIPTTAADSVTSTQSSGASMAELVVDLGKGTLCDVLLRYSSTTAHIGDVQDSPDVWGRYENQLFFIAHKAEDYIRLGAIFHWVCGWQLCFAPCGPLPSAVPWMRLLAPAALAAALAAPS